MSFERLNSFLQPPSVQPLPLAMTSLKNWSFILHFQREAQL